MKAIEINDLRKTYGQVTAVDGIDLSVEQGEIFGILGPNGAGKTTTVEIVEGLTKADSGTVSVLGLDPQRDRQKLRHVLGAQLQQSRLPEKLRVQEALRLYASFYRDPVPIEEMLERVGLLDKRRAFFENLSGGQQQRLSIALALVGRPKIAVLDELTTGLDPNARRSMWQAISDLRDSGVTVLLITHFMEEAKRLCDRIAVLRAGKVMALGTPAQIIRQTAGGQRVEVTVTDATHCAGLLTLPEVESVDTHGDVVTFSGDGDLLSVVTQALHSLGVGYSNVRVHQATLDDAFLQITGSAPESTGADA